MQGVALLSADAGSAPTGTGSFSYFTNFRVVLDNIAFQKVVGIWGHEVGAATWAFHPCTFVESVPGNAEVWRASTGATRIDQFAVEYQGAGNLFWDNNAGFNYVLDTQAAESDGVGTAAIGPNVQVVGWGIDGGGRLRVEVVVANIAFAKQVAIVYTTDGWATFHNAFGTFNRSYAPATRPHQLNVEDWAVSVPVGVGATGQFAVFYTVGGQTYWDNNFGRNYAF